MSSIDTNGPVLLADFPAAYHETYAKNASYIEKTQQLLPTGPALPLSFLSSLSAQSVSHLEDLPFFDCKTLSWSLFDKPRVELSTYPFSARYFSWIENTRKKFANHLKSREDKKDSGDHLAEKALTSLFDLHETLFEIVHFINMRRTVQKA